MVKGNEQFLDEEKALACVHCGLCLGACPTYLETGNENDSPRGRIYLMRGFQEGRLAMTERSVRHIDLCLGCRACEPACPSGVQYGALLEGTREQIEKTYRRSWFQRILRRMVIERIFPHSRRMKWALGPARLIKALGIEKRLPRFAREALALVPDRVEEGKLPGFSPASGSKRGRAGFIQGCVMNVMFGPTNLSSIELLNRAGFDVVTPGAQVCCGALYAHGGNLERARECARANIAVFEGLDLDQIVINAAGCGSTLKEYGHLLEDDAEWAERGRRFSGKVKDLSEVLAENLSRATPTERSGGNGGPVTYHDACHLAHAQRITREPRELVRSVAGEQLVELAESEVCCGSAGSYNLTEPGMAERLQSRKIANILKTGARTVVTTNPGCMLQIQAGLRKAGAADIRVVHLADYLVSDRSDQSDQSDQSDESDESDQSDQSDR